MKRIRMFEDAIAEDYPNRNMHTPIHLYTGQEAIAAGICIQLTKEDTVVSNHRCHGHYLAKGGDSKKMIAELYNKDTGCTKGRGGSMHIMDLKCNVMLSSSIVAGGVPLGTGVGLASRIKGDTFVTVIFLGDAATEEGCVYESICFAKLMNLPVIYICENNKYSICTPLDKREPLESIAGKFCNIINADTVDGNDVEAVYEIAQKMIDRAKRGEGPSFLECVTYRLRDHHNVGTGVELGYRTQEEWDEWSKRSPISQYEKKLVEKGIVDKKEIKEIETEIKIEIAEAFQFAKESALPDKDDLMKYVYQEDE